MAKPDFGSISENYPDFEPVTTAIQRAYEQAEQYVGEGKEVIVMDILAKLAQANPEIFTDMFWYKYMQLGRGSHKIGEYFSEYGVGAANNGEIWDKKSGLILYETHINNPSQHVDIRRYRK